MKSKYQEGSTFSFEFQLDDEFSLNSSIPQTPSRKHSSSNAVVHTVDKAKQSSFDRDKSIFINEE